MLKQRPQAASASRFAKRRQRSAKQRPQAEAERRSDCGEAARCHRLRRAGATSRFRGAAARPAFGALPSRRPRAAAASRFAAAVLSLLSLAIAAFASYRCFIPYLFPLSLITFLIKEKYIEEEEKVMRRRESLRQIGGKRQVVTEGGKGLRVRQAIVKSGGRSKVRTHRLRPVEIH